MRKLFIVIIVLPLLLSFAAHKYYLSVTDITYNESNESLEVVTRLFYDDLEAVLKERYDESIFVDATADQEKLDRYLKKYLRKKLQISVDGQLKTFNFIGKEYEDDFVVCYLEYTDIVALKTLKVENTTLMDLYPEQKNMIHTDILEKKKSFLLINDNPKALLNFSE